MQNLFNAHNVIFSGENVDLTAFTRPIIPLNCQSSRKEAFDSLVTKMKIYNVEIQSIFTVYGGFGIGLSLLFSILILIEIKIDYFGKRNSSRSFTYWLLNVILLLIMAPLAQWLLNYQALTQ